MPTYTISTHTGSGIAWGHNRRDRRITDREDHIDPAGKYEVIRDCDIRDAYNQIFGDAQRKYNARQNRPERQITDYYNAVCKSKQNPVYEMIVTVGNRDAMPAEVDARSVMMDYIAGWQRRNPNMVMVGCYYHADERDPKTGQPSAPHMHIDFVPVAHGYKRGMETRTGYAKALAEMGFNGRMGGASWWQRENQVLEDICRARGWEIIHPERDTPEDAKRRHEQTDNYKQMMSAARSRASEIIQDGQRVYDESQSAAMLWTGRAKQSKAAADESNKRLQELQKATESASEQLEQANNAIRQANADLSKLDADLQRKRQDAANIDTIRQTVATVNAQIDAISNRLQDPGWQPQTAQVIPEQRHFGRPNTPEQVTLDRTEYDRLISRAAAANRINNAAKLCPVMQQATQAAVDDLDVEKQVAARTKRLQDKITDLTVTNSMQDNHIRQQDLEISHLKQDVANACASENAAWDEYDTLCRSLDLVGYDDDKRQELINRVGAAAEMAALLRRADSLQRGESAPGLEYNQWTGGYSYTLSDGRKYDRAHLISAYLDECNRQNITPDPQIAGKGQSIQRHGRSR